MALDVYWQQVGHIKTRLGQLPVEAELDKVLSTFESSGVVIDPYGDSKLYMNQWQRLVSLVPADTDLARAVAAIENHLPTNQGDGFILLVGD